ncbi:hypothetical protein PVV74_11620 [Roseovarius sp. SK2]|uniref:hypothetical protein n=1 Tax=Roseovarius TaxID=74030 RepID=UPI00237B8E5C|nr:hypothetical protein [Roseovarius sp. SK2]MDD9726105.1 hypothetical protein [Roseovarius sp. SK2]
MKTITEIQDALADLVKAMSDKGVVAPKADLKVTTGRFVACIESDIKARSLSGDWLKSFYCDAPEEGLSKARDFIASLPSPEEAVTNEYLKRVASAVDYATENSIDDEYVAPLRGVTCAMTDNLLTKVDA